MQTIAPPFIVNRGIALYVPPLRFIERGGLVSLEISYRRKNPLFSWITCDTSEVKLSSTTQEFNPDGVIFIYETADNLAAGFYTLALQLRTGRAVLKGSMTVGFIQPTPRLLVGLPYSVYGPIALS